MNSSTKFKTAFLEKSIPENKKNKELIEWCKKFSKYNLAPVLKNYSCGNLSFRTKKGMIITGSAVDLGKVKEKDLVEVVKCNKKKFSLEALGLKEPSSESFIHFEIYKRRKEVNAVFHGHGELILRHGKELGLPETKKFQPYGTIALLKEVIKILGKNKLIVMREHGFIAIGRTMKEAGRTALKNYLFAKELEEEG